MYRPLRTALQRRRHGDNALSIPTTEAWLAALRPFSSTTPAPAADDDTPSAKPTLRQRMSAAASGLSALNTSNNTITRDARSAVDARDLGSRPPSGFDPSNNAITPAPGGGRIIDVRSLPRRARGGASSFPGPGVSDPSTSRTGLRPGFRGRGGGGGRGRGRRRGGGRERGGGEDEGGGRNPADKPYVNHPRAVAYLDGLAQGVETPYRPRLELEDLLGHGPVVATTTARSMGQVEGVMATMRSMAGAQLYSGNVNSATLKKEVSKARDPNRKTETHTMFFEVGGREYIKQADKVPGASEETKTKILAEAVQGQYGAGPEFAPTGDILGTLRRYRSRGSSYRTEDGLKLEESVTKLVAKNGATIKQKTA